MTTGIYPEIGKPHGRKREKAFPALFFHHEKILPPRDLKRSK
jgi:hypothetical protein